MKSCIWQLINLLPWLVHLNIIIKQSTLIIATRALPILINFPSPALFVAQPFAKLSFHRVVLALVLLTFNLLVFGFLQTARTSNNSTAPFAFSQRSRKVWYKACSAVCVAFQNQQSGTFSEVQRMYLQHCCISKQSRVVISVIWLQLGSDYCCLGEVYAQLTCLASINSLLQMCGWHANSLIIRA